MNIRRALAVLILGPSPLLAATLPAELVGTWSVDEASVEGLGLPSLCKSIRVNYKQGGETVYESGGLIYKAQSTVQSKGAGLEVTSLPYENNGGANCQGRTSAYFFSHYEATTYVEIAGKQMKFYVLSKDDGRFLLYWKK